jgi:hypothetical protein
VVSLLYILSESPYNPQFYIFTDKGTTSIPKLSAQGLGLPLNRRFDWQVRQFYPMASVDVAASVEFFDLINGRSGDYGQGVSEFSSFISR